VIFTSYHQHLTLDQERLVGFYEAIQDLDGIVYDIGAGSGILSTWAAPHAKFIYSVEKDPSISKMTQLFLKDLKNVSFIKGDAQKIDFPQKADYILCEMLDTALIDEEQVPVLNSLLKYLNTNGKILPYGVINGVEPIDFKTEHICYYENQNPKHTVLGPLNIYSRYHFGKYIAPDANFKLKLNITKEGQFSGIKITTFTLITPEIICGPTPMMNPPLLIPTEKLRVKRGDNVKIELNYQMGGGLQTIKTRICDIS
jgi:predicted RNA methylase